MKVILVDDETSIRDTIKILLSMIAPDTIIIGEANSVASGIQLLKSVKPDLLLLDVEMSDGTGFDLLAQLPPLPYPVIFVTAHNGYAIDAFKYSALDYVLKPIDPDDLQNAIAKAKDVIDIQSQQLQLNNATQVYKNMVKTIVLKDSDSVHLLKIEQIIRCQAEDNYTRFTIEDGRQILVSKTLKEYEKMLTNSEFFRPHQSHLINLNHFLRYDKKEGGMIVMNNQDIVPVSSRKKEGLMDTLSKMK